MNLSDRVLGPSLRAQTVGTRFEVRLEDRFGHQLQRGLHDSVSDSRDPQRADLAARLGNRLLPHPLGPEPASFEIISQPVQHRLDTQDDRSRRDPIDSGSSRALVCPHPAPRHNEKRRVIDEVEHVIERTARIGLRPLVQLRLHREYPRLGLQQVRPRNAGIHQRTPRFALKLRPHWVPSPCARLSRARTTTNPPPHPDGINRRQVFPPAALAGQRKGTNEMVPTFIPEPFDGVGAQLCPCNLVTATPQAFTMTSRPATSTDLEVPRPSKMAGCALQRSPDLSDSSCWIS